MVRLTIFWEAIEPEPGVYDQRYLNKVEDMVNEASKGGIYVLLDMHQDQYSRYLKGDGAPYWALPKNVDPYNNSGIAGPFWFSSYFTSGDVKASFSKQLKEIGVGGLNIIDGPALQWLARQPQPRIWVSDGSVTGVGETQNQWHLDDAAAIVTAGAIIQKEPGHDLIEWLESRGYKTLKNVGLR